MRFSELDLNDNFIKGGRQQNMTMSLAWLLSQNLSLIVEHIKVNPIDEGDFDDASPSLTQARMEILF